MIMTLKQQTSAAINKINQLFNTQHTPATVMAFTQELEQKYKELRAEIEQLEIPAERWNVVQLMKMHIDITYRRISDLNFLSQTLPADLPGQEHCSASQVTSQHQSQLAQSEHKRRTTNTGSHE